MEERRCTAKTRSGSRCRNAPIPGGTVCRMHGGAAPQVKAKADERLRALQDPALNRLEDLLNSATRVVVETKDGPVSIPLIKYAWIEHSGRGYLEVSRFSTAPPAEGHERGGDIEDPYPRSDARDPSSSSLALKRRDSLVDLKMVVDRDGSDDQGPDDGENGHAPGDTRPTQSASCDQTDDDSNYKSDDPVSLHPVRRDSSERCGDADPG